MIFNEFKGYDSQWQSLELTPMCSFYLQNYSHNTSINSQRKHLTVYKAALLQIPVLLSFHRSQILCYLPPIFPTLFQTTHQHCKN